MIGITLTPEREAQLSAVAAVRGVSPEEALNQLIAEAADVAEAVAGIHEGLEDFAAGRHVSLEEFRRDWDAHIAARRRQGLANG